MPRTSPDQVRLVSPSGTSWVTVSPEKAARLRAYGFRTVDDAPSAPAPEVHETSTPELVKPARRRAPRKAQD